MVTDLERLLEVGPKNSEIDGKIVTLRESCAMYKVNKVPRPFPLLALMKLDVTDAKNGPDVCCQIRQKLWAR